MLTHLSLFSGIGGLDLAAEMAGFVTVGQCEWADYPTKILEKHWPDVPRWTDIRCLDKDSFYERTGLRTVDVISGGFPCQPFSVAGDRRGKEDDRYLWPEMCRVISELRPAWVLGENVPGIINLALDEVLADLEGIGYKAQSFVIPACGVDAPHKRERVAIVAYTFNRGSTLCRNGELQNVEEDDRTGIDNGRRTSGVLQGERRQDKSCFAGMADGLRTNVYGANPYTDSFRLSGGGEEQILWEQEIRSSSPQHRVQSPWKNWLPEPELDRVAHGIPNRVDRIKCLGNAVVPQQFYIFFKLMHDILEGVVN